MTKSSIVLTAALAIATACGGAQKGATSVLPTPAEAAGAPAGAPTASAAPSSPSPTSIAPTTTAAVSETPGPAAPAPSAAGSAGANPAEPAGVDIGEVQVTGGTLPNLDEVVGSFRQSFATCVARGRARRPDTEGQISLTIRVGTAGQVLGVAAQQTTKIPASLVPSPPTRPATAQFAPPQKAKTQVAVLVPVTVPRP